MNEAESPCHAKCVMVRLWSTLTQGRFVDQPRKLWLPATRADWASFSNLLKKNLWGQDPGICVLTNFTGATHQISRSLLLDSKHFKVIHHLYQIPGRVSATQQATSEYFLKERIPGKECCIQCFNRGAGEQNIHSNEIQKFYSGLLQPCIIRSPSLQFLARRIYLYRVSIKSGNR